MILAIVLLSEMVCVVLYENPRRLKCFITKKISTVYFVYAVL
jgi:hypothetical protein